MTAPDASAPGGEQHSGHRSKAVPFILAVVAALIVGMAIGNATRKRFERLVRGH